MTTRNILAPIDLEDESTWRKPLSIAIEYAACVGGVVHVMTVVPSEMLRMTVVAQVIPEDFEDKLRKDAENRLANAIKDSGADADALRQIVRLGKIPSEILQVAREIGADQIVMAAHKPTLGDFITGSTTSQVVHRAPCSVWIIRE